MSDSQWAPKALKDMINFDGTAPEIDWRLLGQGRLLDRCTRSNPELTFMIPFAADSLSRVINLCLVVSHLLMNTSSKILLTIADVNYTLDELQNNPRLGNNGRNWNYEGYFFATLAQWWGGDTFEKVALGRLTVILRPRKPGEPFHRTLYLNDMLEQVTTRYVANLDADVLIDASTIRLAQTMLSTTLDGDGVADFIYPYGHGQYSLRVWAKHQLETSSAPDGHREAEEAASAELAYAIIELIAKDNIDLLYYQNSILDVVSVPWSSAFGHIFFAKTEAYLRAYGENENFVSWGAEDIERFTRFSKLGFKVMRFPYPVVHLEHPRGLDSGKSNPHFQSNEDLWVSLQDKDVDWIKNYYENCEYYKARKWKSLDMGELFKWQ